REEVRLAVNNAAVWELSLLGVQVADLSEQMARQLNLSHNVTGLLVAWIDPKGPLAGHVQRGDVIDRIEQQQIRSVQEAQRELAARASLQEGHADATSAPHSQSTMAADARQPLRASALRRVTMGS